MKYTDFSQKIKEKYPQYQSIDDKVLAEKMIAKYPAYKQQVEFDSVENNSFSKYLNSQYSAGNSLIKKGVEYGVDKLADTKFFKEAGAGANEMGAITDPKELYKEAKTGFPKIAKNLYDTVATKQGREQLSISIVDAGIPSLKSVFYNYNDWFWGVGNKVLENIGADTFSNLSKNSKLYNREKAQKANNELKKFSESYNLTYGTSNEGFWNKITSKDGTTFIANLLGSQLPTFGALMLSGGLSKALSIPEIPAIYSGALALNTGDAYQQGKQYLEENNIPLDKEWENKLSKTSILSGSIVSVLDTIGMEKVLGTTKFVNFKNAFARNLTNSVLDTGVDTLFEGGTEGIQEFIQNVFAKTYNENQSLLQGVAEASFGGGIMGGGASFIMNSNGLIHSKASKSLREGKEEKEVVKEIVEGAKEAGVEISTEKAQEIVRDTKRGLDAQKEDIKTRISNGELPTAIISEIVSSSNVNIDEVSNFVDNIALEVNANGESKAVDEVKTTTDIISQKLDNTLLEGNSSELQAKLDGIQQSLSTDINKANEEINSLREKLATAKNGSVEKKNLKKRIATENIKLRKIEEQFKKETNSQAENLRSIIGNFITEDIKHQSPNLDNLIDKIITVIGSGQSLSTPIKDIIASEIQADVPIEPTTKKKISQKSKTKISVGKKTKVEIGGELYNGEEILENKKKIGKIAVDFDMDIPEIKALRTTSQKNGSGTKILKNLFKNNKANKYYIRSTPSAKKFWEKMGVKDFSLNKESGLFEGYLTRENFIEIDKEEKKETKSKKVEKPIKARGGKVVKTKKTTKAVVKKAPTKKKATKDQALLKVLTDDNLTVAEKVDTLLGKKQEDKKYKDVGERVAGSKKENAIIQAVIQHGDDALLKQLADELGVNPIITQLNKQKILEDVEVPTRELEISKKTPAWIAGYKVKVYNTIGKVPTIIQKSGKYNTQTIVPNNTIDNFISKYPQLLKDFVKGINAIKDINSLKVFKDKYRYTFAEIKNNEGDPVSISSEVLGKTIPNAIRGGGKFVKDTKNVLRDIEILEDVKNVLENGVQEETGKFWEGDEYMEGVRYVGMDDYGTRTELYKTEAEAEAMIKSYRKDNPDAIKEIDEELKGYATDFDKFIPVKTGGVSKQITDASAKLKRVQDTITQILEQKEDLEDYQKSILERNQKEEKELQAYIARLKGETKAIKHGNFEEISEYDVKDSRFKKSQVNATTLMNKYGFKSAQLGNYMDDKSAHDHIVQTMGAMEDMSKILNVDFAKIANKFGLSIAFGARGGGGSAVAHYEPTHNIINLTKKRGDGSFGHEFMHFLDWNVGKETSSGKLSGAVSRRYYQRTDIGKTAYLITEALINGVDIDESVSFVPEDISGKSERQLGLANDFRNSKSFEEGKAFLIESSRYYRLKENLQSLANVYRKSFTENIKKKSRGFYQASFDYGGGNESSYWVKPHELWARAFQAYLEDKMEQKGIKNNYLTNPTKDISVYPQGEERVEYNKLFDQLFEGIAKEYPLVSGDQKLAEGVSDTEYNQMTVTGRDFDNALYVLPELSTKEYTDLEGENTYAHKDLISTSFEKENNREKMAVLNMLYQNYDEVTKDYGLFKNALAKLKEINPQRYKGIERDGSDYTGDAFAKFLHTYVYKANNLVTKQKKHEAKATAKDLTKPRFKLKEQGNLDRLLGLEPVVGKEKLNKTINIYRLTNRKDFRFGDFVASSRTEAEEYRNINVGNVIESGGDKNIIKKTVPYRDLSHNIKGNLIYTPSFKLKNGLLYRVGEIDEHYAKRKGVFFFEDISTAREYDIHKVYGEDIDTYTIDIDNIKGKIKEYSSQFTAYIDLYPNELMSDFLREVMADKIDFFAIHTIGDERLRRFVYSLDKRFGQYGFGGLTQAQGKFEIVAHLDKKIKSKLSKSGYKGVLYNKPNEIPFFSNKLPNHTEVVLFDQKLITKVENKISYKIKDIKTTPLTDGGDFLQDIKNRLKIDFDVQFVDNILADGNREAYGATYDNTIALVKNLADTTAQHEVIHLTLANMSKINAFKGITAEEILTAKAKELGIKYNKKTKKYLEEELAKDFEKYDAKKHTPIGKIKVFFEKLLSMLQKWAKVVVKTKGDIIKDYYDTLLFGESVNNKMVKFENNGLIESFVENGVLDLSDELKNIRFKLKEEKAFRNLKVKHNQSISKMQLVEAGLNEKRVKLSNALKLREMRKNVLDGKISSFPVDLRKNLTKEGVLSIVGEKIAEELGYNPKDINIVLKDYLQAKAEFEEIRELTIANRNEIAGLNKESDTLKLDKKEVERRLVFASIKLREIKKSMATAKQFGREFVDNVEKARTRQLREIIAISKIAGQKTEELLRNALEEKGDYTKLSDDEFIDYVNGLTKLSQQAVSKELSRNDLYQFIAEKKFKNLDNLRLFMELPTVKNMTAPQLKTFKETLSAYEYQDVFLTKKQIETLPRTKYGTIKTRREYLQAISENDDISIEDLKNVTLPKYFKNFANGLILSRHNKFLKYIVESLTLIDIKTEKEYIPYEVKIEKLGREARKSRPKSVKEHLKQLVAPTDKIVFDYVEKKATQKEQFAKDNKMTPEELKFGNTIIAFNRIVHKNMVDVYNLTSSFGEFKEEDYIAHIRREFLEGLVDDGIKVGVREMLNSQKEAEIAMNITPNTGEKIPYEKWSPFHQYRSGKLVPTKNVVRLHLIYAKTFFKKKHLDRYIPELLTVLSFRKDLLPHTPTGLTIDGGIEEYIKKLMNTVRGRKISDSFIPEQGSTADATLGMIITITTLQALGGRFFLQVGSFVGEFVTTMTSAILQPRKLVRGITRTIQFKKANDIRNETRHYIKLNPFTKLRSGQYGVPKKLANLVMILFSYGRYLSHIYAIQMELTPEEWDRVQVADERLLEISKEQNKFKKGEFHSGSLVGSTVIGRMFGQYLSWAFDIATTFLSSSTRLVETAKKEGLSGIKKSEYARDILNFAVMSTIMVFLTYLIFGMLGEDDEEKKKKKLSLFDIATSNYGKDVQRTALFYAVRDANTLISSFFALLHYNNYSNEIQPFGLPIIQKATDLFKFVQQFASQEQYKVDGKGFGIGDKKYKKTFKRLVLPVVLYDALGNRERHNTKLEMIKESISSGNFEPEEIAKVIYAEDWQNKQNETRTDTEQRLYKQKKIGELRKFYHIVRDYSDSKVAEILLNDSKNTVRVKNLLELSKEIGSDIIIKELKNMHRDRNLYTYPKRAKGGFVSRKLIVFFLRGLSKNQK